MNYFFSALPEKNVYKDESKLKKAFEIGLMRIFLKDIKQTNYIEKSITMEMGKKSVGKKRALSLVKVNDGLVWLWMPQITRKNYNAQLKRRKWKLLLYVTIIKSNGNIAEAQAAKQKQNPILISYQK